MTVCEAIQLPAVARESTATIIPPWKRNAKVVVPWAILILQSGLTESSVWALKKSAGWEIGGMAIDGANYNWGMFDDDESDSWT